MRKSHSIFTLMSTSSLSLMYLYIVYSALKFVSGGACIIYRQIREWLLSVWVQRNYNHTTLTLLPHLNIKLHCCLLEKLFPFFLWLKDFKDYKRYVINLQKSSYFRILD